MEKIIGDLHWFMFWCFMTGFSFCLILLADLPKYIIKKSKCEHKNKGIYVEEVAATCEKTTITCLDCKKKLSTKTEC